jgi:NADH dehydrogenase [ubiquinone] 1 alpha subcomplex assembly factor 5
LSSAGFTLLTLDFDEIHIAYPSIFELMTDIKGMGESNCSYNRKLNLNTDLLMATQAIYKGKQLYLIINNS